jgi:hypothetical protein
MVVTSRVARCASASPKIAVAAAAAVAAVGFAAAVAAADRAVAVATAAAVVTAENPALKPIAMAIGEAWAHEMVRALRHDERDIVGAWPGTISEAKMRVLAHLNTLDLEVLADLARVAIGAARREWLIVAERDPEA